MTSPVSQWGRFAWHQQMWPHYRGVTDVVGKDFCDGKIFCWSIRMIYQSQLNYFIWFEGGIKRRGNKPEHLIRLYLMRIIWWEPSLHHPEHGATDVPHKSISSEDNLHYWVSFSVIVSRMVCILCQTPSGDCTENMMFIVLLLLIFYLVNW